MKTCLDETGLAIVDEICKAVAILAADPGLLAILSSWGDTLDDADVLEGLKNWNEMGEPFMPDKSVR